MCKKPLVLAMGLLCSIGYTANAEEAKPKFSLEECTTKYPDMEKQIQKIGGIERLAVVIGNQDYPGDPKDADDLRWTRLFKTVKDAKAMKEKFIAAEFHVLYKEDAKKQDLDRLVCRTGFILKFHPVKTAVFYYSGHGLQNILVPTDMDSAKANDPQAFSIDNIVEIMDQSHKENKYVKQDDLKRNHLVLLDSCRNGTNGKGGKGPRPKAGINGLVGDKEASGGALTTVRPLNLLVSYAAAPNQSSYENPDKDARSFYSDSLLKNLFEKSITVKQAIDKVRENVYRETEEFIALKKQDTDSVVRDEYKDSLPQQISNDDAVKDFYLAGQQELKPGINN